MPEFFDGYYKWLGIPPENQPPNHYELLAVPALVDDPEVIQNSADRQMNHIRTFQGGRHAELSQRLLNEVASAKLCLLDPVRKSAYDAALRSKSSAVRSPSAIPKASRPKPPRASRPKASADVVVALPRRDNSLTVSRLKSRRKHRRTWAVVAVTLMLVALSAILVVAAKKDVPPDGGLASASHVEILS